MPSSQETSTRPAGTTLRSSSMRMDAPLGASMLVDRNAPGDGEKARALLTEAVAMYRRIGMPKHIEMSEALLGEV